MDRVKFLLLGLILLGCIIVPLATKAAPRSHLGDIEAPYRADGIATADIDLGTGGYSLILADGAAGSATGSWYFLNDTDSGAYWKGADNWSLMANGGDKLRITASAVVAEVAINSRGVNYNSGGDYIIGDACDAAGTTGNVCVGGALLTVDNALQLDGTATFAVPPVFAGYTRHHDVPIGAAIVGAAAPAVETIGTFRCYVFDANADLAHISVEVPSEWNGSSDMAIDVLIFTDQGDALGNGEVIEFDLVYRSVDEGEAYDNGTAVTILANVTGGASEVDKGQYKITATVDHDDTDQPLAVNDTLGFSLMRDVTTGDTYSGDVHVCRAQLVYTANALATH